MNLKGITLFIRHTVEVRVRAQEQASITYCRTSVKDTLVTDEGVLGELLELGFGFQHKSAGIAAYRNNFPINKDGGVVELRGAARALKACTVGFLSGLGV